MIIAIRSAAVFSVAAFFVNAPGYSADEDLSQAHAALGEFIRRTLGVIETPVSIKFSEEISFNGSPPGAFYVKSTERQFWAQPPLFRSSVKPGLAYPGGMYVPPATAVWNGNSEVNYQRFDNGEKFGIGNIKRDAKASQGADECLYITKMGVPHASKHWLPDVSNSAQWLKSDDFSRFGVFYIEVASGVNCFVLEDTLRSDKLWVTSSAPHRLLRREFKDAADYCTLKRFDYVWSDLPLPDEIRFVGFKDPNGAGEPYRRDTLKLREISPGPFSKEVFGIKFEKGTEVLDIDSRAIIVVQDSDADPFSSQIALASGAKSNSNSRLPAIIAALLTVLTVLGIFVLRRVSS